jgi:hypothetical protein
MATCMAKCVRPYSGLRSVTGWRKSGAWKNWTEIDKNMIGLLEKFGLTRDQVRRSVAAAIRKNSCGRRGLPDSAVDVMFEDYKRLNSLAKVAKLYNRTRQSIYDLFHGRDFALNKKTFNPVVIYKGRKFTTGKGGYLRDTIFRRGRKQGEAQLHRVMWVDLHGPIPDGCQVSFKDGDKTNYVPGNLFCLPIREVTLFHYRRHFGERAAMTPEQRHEWWKAFYRRYAARRAAAWVAKGLRTDGKPRRRGVSHQPFEFRYFPPREPNPERAVRRQTFRFSGKRTRFDLLYEEIRAEMELPARCRQHVGGGG